MVDLTSSSLRVYVLCCVFCAVSVYFFPQALRQNKRFPQYVWLSYDEGEGKGLKAAVKYEESASCFQEDEDALLDGVLFVSSRIFEDLVPAAISGVRIDYSSFPWALRDELVPSISSSYWYSEMVAQVRVKPGL